MTDTEIQVYIDLARKASTRAYAPYSNIKVGAILVTEQGVIEGCNVENGSYGLTMCAERNALFHSVMKGVMYRNALFLSIPGSDKEIFPCGACLQVLNEFVDDDMMVVTNWGDSLSTYNVYKFVDLLPHRNK